MNLGCMTLIPTVIAIAQLTLKHCYNKNLWQHMIVFVSLLLNNALPDVELALIHLAKKLKKNNVVLDMVAFGDSIKQASKGGHSNLPLSKTHPCLTT